MLQCPTCHVLEGVDQALRCVPEAHLGVHAEGVGVNIQKLQAHIGNHKGRRAASGSVLGEGLVPVVEQHQVGPVTVWAWPASSSLLIDYDQLAKTD